MNLNIQNNVGADSQRHYTHPATLMNTVQASSNADMTFDSPVQMATNLQAQPHHNQSFCPPHVQASSNADMTFDSPVQMATNLQAQPHHNQSFPPHVQASCNVDMTFDSPVQMATNLQAQPHHNQSFCPPFPPHVQASSNADMTFDSLVQMATNLQAQPHHNQSFPPHVQASCNVDMRSMSGNTGNRAMSYPTVSYHEPIPGVDTSMNGQLNTPSRNQVETHKNSFCSLCGHSNGYFGTIKSRSIAHTFTQTNAFNEPEYVITREVRIQLVLGRVPTNASFDEVIALTRQ